MAVDVMGASPFERMHALDGRLGELVQRLTQARQRSAYGAVLAGAVASLVVGLAVFALLELLHSLLGELAPWLAFSGLAQPDWVAHLIVAALFAAFALGATLVFAFSRRPWLTSMARAADRRFALGEVMSTALELSGDSGRRVGVVPEALIRSAAIRSGSVDARRLVPMRLPGMVWAVPVLLAIGVLLAVAPPPALLERAFGGPGGALANDPAAAAERDAVAAQLRAVAAIIQQDAEERADPILQAVAREVDRLGAELAANPGANRAEIAEELERLRGVAGEAYLAAGEPAGGTRDLTRLLEAATAAVDPTRGAVTPATEERPAQATQGRDETVLEAVLLDREYGAAPNAGEGALAGGGLTVNPNNINQTGVGGPLGNYANTVEDYNPDYEEFYRDDPTVPGEGGVGEMFAAAVAGAGEGDMAGGGVAPLTGPDARLAAERMAAAAEMILADRAQGDGRRITLNLPPLAALMPVDGEGLETAAGWRTFVEGQVERRQLPPLARDIVQRYFDAMMAETAE
jgi:hypothetical protein